MTWTHPDIPHAGWFYAGVELHEQGDFMCEVCHFPFASVAHILMHRDHEGMIKVARLCAVWLTGGDPDVVDRWERKAKGLAGHRERLMARHAIARERWGNPRTWRVSKNGNYWRQAGGVNVTVFRGPRNPQVWRAAVGEDFGTIEHPTASEAMLATFDRMFPLGRLLRELDENGLEPRLPGEGIRGCSGPSLFD